MTLTVVRGGYAELREQWSRLAKAQPASGAPFTTPEFGEVWWRVFGSSHCGELELLGLQDGAGELAGMIPLLHCTEDAAAGSVFGFAGDHEISDYLGLCAAEGREADVVAALLDHLDEHEADSADLRGLPPGSPWPELIAAQGADRGWSVDLSDEAVCPVVDISGGWDVYLGRLRSRDRREVRRKLRALRQLRGAVSFAAFDEQDEINERLPLFMEMMADSRGDKAAFLTEQMQTFFSRLTESLAAAGWVRLYLMSISGEPAAMVLCFVVGDELLLYNSGYDPRFRDLSAGLASKVLCIRDAVERGLGRVNFLRGDEPYKFELGGEPAIVRRVLLRRGEAS